MSPRVEVPTNPNEYIKIPDFFIVDLSSPDAFDADLFDRQCAVIDPMRPKFIVQDDKMFIFNSHIFYVSFLSILKKGKIQCAGEIGFTRDGTAVSPGNGAERIIKHYSVGLSNEGILSRNASDEYKCTVLVQKLGAHFQIEY